MMQATQSADNERRAILAGVYRLKIEDLLDHSDLSHLRRRCGRPLAGGRANRKREDRRGGHWERGRKEGEELVRNW
jgi:hypothetical protein